MSENDKFYPLQFGVIDTRFYITGLPLSEIGPHKRHHVNGHYIKTRNSDQSFHDNFVPVDVFQTDSCGTDSNEFPNCELNTNLS